MRSLAGEKLDRLGEEIAALSRFRADLERVLADWDRRLESAPRRRAGLLEALMEIEPPLPESRGRGSPESRAFVAPRKA